MHAAPSPIAHWLAPLLPFRFLSAQLRQPNGIFGRWVMTRALNIGNAELITASVDALALQPNETFMDVGFGGGLGLRLALTRTNTALWGVDFSPDVVRAGMRSFDAFIARGRLSLICADVLDLPLRDGLVDAICSTNTLYFWPDPVGSLRSLRRVLRRDGRLALGFSGATKMRGYGPLTSQGFTLYEPAQVEALLREAGFSQVETRAQHGAFSRGDYVCLAVR
jgi:SAM-dependent methyltransferase